MYALDEQGKPILAPCRPDGSVQAVNATKEAICRCRDRSCLVDPQNRVVHWNWGETKGSIKNTDAKEAEAYTYA